MHQKKTFVFLIDNIYSQIGALIFNFNAHLQEQEGIEQSGMMSAHCHITLKHRS
tara:strand:- start:595 stop:756 length:162 start_codon:yes stop_codon:yes gene_type:complete